MEQMNENAAAPEAAAVVTTEQEADVAGLPTETAAPVAGDHATDVQSAAPTVDQPVVDQSATTDHPAAGTTEDERPAKPEFSIARVDSCVLRMWEHVNAGTHDVIEEIERLLGIEKEE